MLADANFPSASICHHGPELVRADGHGIPPLLKAITQLFPLDTYVPAPVCSTATHCTHDLVAADNADVEKGAVDTHRSILVYIGKRIERS